MMNYEIFKEVVAEKFMDYMPSQYKDMKLEIHPVDKVNVTLDGMNLVGEGDIKVTPVSLFCGDRKEEKNSVPKIVFRRRNINTVVFLGPE